MQGWAEGLADLVWPRDQTCELCGSGPVAPALSPARVCLSCAASAFAFRGYPCRVCGRPVPSAGPGPVCDECNTPCNSADPTSGGARRTFPRALPPTFPRPSRRTVALGMYEGRLAGWVRALKYENRPELARPLGSLLSLVVAGSFGPRAGGECAPRRSRRRGVVPRAAGWEAVVVPVPMHPERLRERGYNQAELIAEALAHALDLAIEPGALVRTQASPSQASLDRQTRLRNLKGAFSPAGPAPGFARRGYRRRLEGSDVLLVDDVLTTGATLGACSGALLAAGAGRVFGAVVAAGIPRRLWE